MDEALCLPSAPLGVFVLFLFSRKLKIALTFTESFRIIGSTNECCYLALQ
jgi:hypothetical protein